MDYSASNISRLKGCQMACMRNRIVVHDFILSLAPACHIFQGSAVCLTAVPKLLVCVCARRSAFACHTLKVICSKPLDILDPCLFQFFFHGMMAN